mmetsp:Transcript_19494/g.49215  ORF Transcript_19494/g.49215 Transcript_19494/m.49215 type:complete len:205 (-) Transcript_19494:459-1073(-)
MRSTRRCATGSLTCVPPTTSSARPSARTRSPRSCATSSRSLAARPRLSRSSRWASSPIWSLRVWAVARTPSGCSTHSRMTRRWASSAWRQVARAPTPTSTAPRSRSAGPACSTARAPSCCRAMTARSRRRTRSAQALTTPALARSTPTSRPLVAETTFTALTVRLWRGSSCCPSARASSQHSRRPTRSSRRASTPRRWIRTQTL